MENNGKGFWNEQKGKVFTLNGGVGGDYTILDVLNEDTLVLERDDGYRLEAHLPQINNDGTIEWAYSSVGHFKEKDKSLIISTQSDLDFISVDYDGLGLIIVDSRADEILEICSEKYPVNFIQIKGYSNVRLFGNVEAHVFDKARVIANDNAIIVAEGAATVTARDNAEVRASEYATVWASGNTLIYARDFVKVSAIKDAKINARGHAVVDANDDIHVNASENAHVNIKTEAVVELKGNATASYENDMVIEEEFGNVKIK